MELFGIHSKETVNEWRGRVGGAPHGHAVFKLESGEKNQSKGGDLQGLEHVTYSTLQINLSFNSKKNKWDSFIFILFLAS